MADAYAVPPELTGSYWGQLVAATPTLSDDGRIVRIGRQPSLSTSKTFYQGGEAPPPAAQMTPQMRAQIYATGGTGSTITEKQAAELQKLGWTYGQPAPKGYRYDSNGVLIKPESVAHQAGTVAMQAAPLVATLATAGVASPWLAASIAGATGAGAAKLTGASWKQSLIAGAAGAAGAGLAAAPVSTASRIAGQAGINAGATLAGGGSARDALASGAVGAGSAAATAAPKGGGTVATPTAPAKTSLTDYLIQAGLGAGAAAAGGGGAAAIAAGAANGAGGAATGRTNTQAAVGSGATIASRILSGAQAAGNVAGNAAAAREAGRNTEADQMMSQDRDRLAAQIAEENARQGRATTEIHQREEGRASTNDAYKNALLSALALNTHDVSANRPDGVPTIAFSGGARPSAIGAQGHQAAEVANRRALDTLMNPSPLMDLPTQEHFTPSVLPKATGVDTALNIGGVVGNFLTGMQQNNTANDNSSLIRALIQQSQAAAAGGLDKQPAAPAARPPVAAKPGDPIYDPAVFANVRF